MLTVSVKTKYTFRVAVVWASPSAPPSLTPYFNCFSSQMRSSWKTGTTSCRGLPGDSVFLSEACTRVAHYKHLQILMEARSPFLFPALSPPSLSVASTERSKKWSWLSFLAFPEEGWQVSASMVVTHSFIPMYLLTTILVSGFVPGMGKIMVIKTDLVFTLLEPVF